MSEDVWTIARILKTTQDYFAAKGIDSPRLDAEVLLAHVLKVGRVHLYTHHDRPLDTAERDAYRELVRRRAAREPVAYILAEREFYGRAFTVTRDVLVPRPETEHLVDAVLAWARERGLAAPRLADLGTGSGAIAVTLAAELPDAHVVATDLSPAALEVARGNAARLGVGERVELLHGDLLAPLAALSERRFDVIASNPPYVPETDRRDLQPEVRDHEPAMALFAGADGLAVIRRLVAEAGAFLGRPGLLAFEIGAGQAAAVRALCEQHGWPAVEFAADLQGHPRVALVQLHA